LAAGVWVGNWIFVPLMRRCSHWEGFCIGFIAALLVVGIKSLEPVSKA
jgi:hypothetical protein